MPGTKQLARARPPASRAKTGLTKSFLRKIPRNPRLCNCTRSFALSAVAAVRIAAPRVQEAAENLTRSCERRSQIRRPGARGDKRFGEQRAGIGTPIRARIDRRRPAAAAISEQGQLGFHRKRPGRVSSLAFEESFQR